MSLGDHGHMRGNHETTQTHQDTTHEEARPHGDEYRMDSTQDAIGLYGLNIITPSGPIIRSWVKKLKQVF